MSKIEKKNSTVSGSQTFSNIKGLLGVCSFDRRMKTAPWFNRHYA